MSKSLFEVRTYMHPDTFEWDGFSFEYERIVGVYVTDGKSGRVAGNTSRDFDTRTFAMPRHMTNGLLDATRLVVGQEEINCHRFSRILHPKYAKLGRRGINNHAFEPIPENMSKLRQVETLGMGAIGVVGVVGYDEAPHSFVGLGDDAPDSIQVMSRRGELGLANNQEMLGFYRKLFDGDQVDLYCASN